MLIDILDKMIDKTDMSLKPKETEMINIGKRIYKNKTYEGKFDRLIS